MNGDSMNQKNNSHRASSFLLWVFLMVILFAGIVVGVALMTPGGEIIGATIAAFCAFAFGVLMSGPASK